MATTPRISTGLGKLDPALWARIMESVERSEQPSPQPSQSRIARRTFLAKLSDENPRALTHYMDEEDTTPNYADYKYIWQYSFEEVDLKWGNSYSDGTAKHIPSLATPLVGNGHGGSPAGTAENTAAYNLVEIRNTEFYMGPGIELPDDGAIVPEPVEKDQIVIMHGILDPNGDPDLSRWFYYFTQDNPLSCDAEEGARSATLALELDLGSFTSPTLSHSTLDFGAFT